MSDKPKIPVWLVPILVVGGFVMLLALSDREPTMEGGIPVISTMDRYNQLSQETQAYLADPLKKVDAGGELTEQEKGSLQRGIAPFEAMQDFAPTEMTPSFVLAKIYLALDRYQEAEERSRQSIINGEELVKQAKGRSDEKATGEYQALLNESHHVHAQVLFDQKQYKESFAEMKTLLQFGNPDEVNTPRYLVTAARALIELKDTTAARKSLEDALSRDPNNKQAKQLLGFLKNSE